MGEVSGGSRKNTTLQPLTRQTMAELQSEWAASRKKAEAAEAAKKAKQVDSAASTASTGNQSGEETTDETEEATSLKLSPRGDGSFSRRSLLASRHAFSSSPGDLSNFVAEDHSMGWKPEKKSRNSNSD